MIGLIKGLPRKVNMAGSPQPIFTFTSNVKGLYLPEIIAYIEATQSGSGDPSPSNPRTINGVSEVKTVNTPDSDWNELWQIDNGFKGTVSFNQWAKELTASNWTSVNVTPTYSDGEVTIVSNTDSVLIKSLYPLRVTIVGHLYLVCGFGKSDGTAEVNIGIWQSNGGDYTGSLGTSWSTNTSYSYMYKMTKASDTDSIIGARLRNVTPMGNYGVFKNIQVIDLTQMFGSTIADYIYSLEQNEAGAGVAFFRNLYPDDYYAYTAGTTETVGGDDKIEVTTALGGTYYGGYLNVTTGLLTVTDVTEDMGNLTWYRTTSYTNPMFYASLTGKEPIDAGFMCEKYKYLGSFSNASSFSASENYTCGDSTINTQIYFRNDDYSDPASFKTAMTGTLIKYQLATPQTVQLTPAQLAQLLGQNNVFCSSGDVAVTQIWARRDRSIISRG